MLHWSEILPQRVSSGAEHIVTEGGILDRLDSRLDTMWVDSMCCSSWDDGAVVVVVADVVVVVVIVAVAALAVTTIVVRTVDATATTDTAVTAIQSCAVLNNCCG